jgi:hypothetical protein
MEISRVSGCSGDILKIRGEIKEGDYVRFRSFLGGERKVIGVDLSSEGGALEDGFRIAELAHQKRLTTYVSKECDSACAFIFLTSRKRYISQGARIGVHSVANARGGEDPRTIHDTIRLARLSAKLGVPPSTIGKMVATPPGKISYLGEEDFSALKAVVRDPFAHIAGKANTSSDERKVSSICGTAVTKELSNSEPSPQTANDTVATDEPQPSGRSQSPGR